MVLYVAKSLSTKLVLWALIMSVLYSLSTLLGVESILPVRRVRATVTAVDMHVFIVWAEFVCLALTELFLNWQLEAVIADKKSVLKTGVSLMALMVVAVALLTKFSVQLGMLFIFQIPLPPINPVVLKSLTVYLGVTMYLFSNQMTKMVSDKRVTFKVVGGLVSLWTAAVAAMSWGFLHFRLFVHFSEVHTLVDIKHVNYLPLLLASFAVFLVVDVFLTRRAPAVVVLHPPEARGPR